jgi:hypothetical protein
MLKHLPKLSNKQRNEGKVKNKSFATKKKQKKKRKERKKRNNYNQIYFEMNFLLITMYAVNKKRNP